MKQLTLLQMEEFTNAEKCYICKKRFKNTNKRVRDHDHLTGTTVVHHKTHETYNTASIH